MANQLTISLPPIEEQPSWSPIKYSPLDKAASALFGKSEETTFRVPLSPLKLFNPDAQHFPATPPCSPNLEPVERAPSTPRPLKRKSEQISNNPTYPKWLIDAPGKKYYKYNPEHSVHQALFLYQNDLADSHILEHSYFCRYQYCPFHHPY